MMKILAVKYFSELVSTLEGTYTISSRQKLLRQCTLEEKAQDFLFAIPIAGFGNYLDPRQYRAVLCYMLGIPLFTGRDVCPCCNKKVLDEFGDHALQCGYEVGYKLRHNLVRDTLFDVLAKAGISVQREAPLEFLSSDGKVGLRPADVLIYGWDRGRNVCVDVTGVSPMVGLDKGGLRTNGAVEGAARRKIAKHGQVCEANGVGFVPFAFSTLGGMGVDAVELMRRVKQIVKGHGHGHGHGLDTSCYFWPRICFAIQKGVGAQLVARLPINFV